MDQTEEGIDQPREERKDEEGDGHADIEGHPRGVDKGRVQRADRSTQGEDTTPKKCLVTQTGGCSWRFGIPRHRLLAHRMDLSF